jgi:hypothetical protein
LCHTAVIEALLIVDLLYPVSSAAQDIGKGIEGAPSESRPVSLTAFASIG